MADLADEDGVPGAELTGCVLEAELAREGEEPPGWKDPSYAGRVRPFPLRANPPNAAPGWHRNAWCRPERSHLMGAFGLTLMGSRGLADSNPASIA